MKFIQYETGGKRGIAIETETGFRGLVQDQPGYPGDLLDLIRDGGDALALAGERIGKGDAVDIAQVTLLPPVDAPEKIICVGLNYHDHASESGFEAPAYPALFSRYNSTLIGHGAPIIKPAASDQLDFEGELVAVIGRQAHKVDEARALEHVMGYSIFNDVSVRDYQFKSAQWTPGKNFDATGPFGPWLITSDALPAGCKGLTLTTRLNGEVVQQAPIDDMIFSVAQTVSLCSQFMTLKPGDVIVTGTPAGVGMARKPPLWMKDGDTCEVEVEGIGVLSNPVRAEGRAKA